MKQFIINKLTPALIVLSMVLSMVSFALPEKAEATGFPVIDAAQVAQNVVIIANTGGTAASTYASQLRDYGLNTLATALAKQLIRTITASVVNWINSGFEGSPSFITNPGGFLIDVADQITGDFLAKYGGPLTDLCSPFSIDLRLALSFKYHPKIQKRYECTLSKIITNSKNAVNGATINGFAAGDFRQGGWPAFVSMTTEPQNNPYGSYLTADSELSVRVANAQLLKDKEVSNGNGFLSWRDPSCKKEVNAHNDAIQKSYQDGAVNSTVPTQNIGAPAANEQAIARAGTSNSSNTASAINAYALLGAAGDASNASGSSGSNAPLGNVDYQSSTENVNDPRPYLGGDATPPTRKSVSDCPINTPGSLIQGTLLQHIGGPTYELELVDSINQIVGALAAQLVTTVLQKGLAAASGSSASDSTAYLNQIQQEAATAQLGSMRNDFLNNVESYITTTFQYKYYKDQSLNLMLNAKSSFDAVDACYTGKIRGTQPVLTPAQVSQAQAKITETDAIVNTNINPQAVALLAKTKDVDDRYKILTSLRDQANAATTINGLNSPLGKFSQMAQDQSLITSQNVAEAQLEFSSLKDQTDSFQQDAKRRLQECQIFPFTSGALMR